MGSDGLHGAQAHRRGRRRRDRAGRSHQRRLGHARPGRAGRAVLGGAAARSDRPARCMRLFARGARMTPQDYDFIRKLLRERSGLVLSVRQAISGRKPAAAGGAQGRPRQTSPDLVAGAQAAPVVTARLHRGRGDDDQRVVLLPRQVAVRAFPRPGDAGAAGGAGAREAHPHLVRRRGDRAGALFAGDVAQGHGRQAVTAGASKFSRTDMSSDALEKAKAGLYSQFEVQRGLPIQVLVKYFTQVGELWQIAPEIRAMVQFRHVQPAARFLALRRCSTSCSAATC